MMIVNDTRHEIDETGDSRDDVEKEESLRNLVLFDNNRAEF